MGRPQLIVYEKVRHFRVGSKFQDATYNCIRFSKFGGHTKFDVLELSDFNKYKNTCCAARLSRVLTASFYIAIYRRGHTFQSTNCRNTIIEHSRS